MLKWRFFLWFPMAKTPYHGRWPCGTALFWGLLLWIWGSWPSSSCSTACWPGCLSNRPCSQCWGPSTGQHIASPQHSPSRYSSALSLSVYCHIEAQLTPTLVLITPFSVHHCSVSCVRSWCGTGSLWLTPPACGQCVRHPGVSGSPCSASRCTSSVGPSSAASSWSLITQNYWASSR